MSESLDTRTEVILLGGEENSLSVCRSLGRRGVKVHLVVAADCAARYSRYAASVALIDGREQWQEKLQQLLLGTDCTYPKGSVLLPGNDASIEFIAANDESLRESYLLEPATATQRQQMLSKWETLELANRLGCAAPGFWPPDPTLAAAEMVERVMRTARFPLLVKPVHSHLFYAVFGVKCFLIENEEQLLQRLQQIESTQLECIVSEHIPGPDSNLSSVYCYVNEAGEEQFCFTKRIVRRSPKNFGGACLHATQWLPETADAGMDFFRGIGFRGIGNIEFKYDERDEQLKIIECNARFTAAQELVYRSGVDIAEIVYRDLTGQSVEKPADFREDIYYWYWDRDILAFRELRRLAEITFGEWIRSIRRPLVFPYFSLLDPKPFLYRLGRLIWQRLPQPVQPGNR